ncbi:MAG: hypothetical protein KC501_10045 [Myxococcales bacterium]|nr:hypothetical protein [Myxococcales bacterium]
MPEPAEPPSNPRHFGAFEGVFTPTVLTILGVIMYLREGWVVGQVGLLGAILIITLASVITSATALSLSSIATNVQLDAGGPYAIISRSLGLELGGSVGIPQYLSQALAVAMYIFGLREGWRWIFPGHSALIVDLVAFAVVLLIAMTSASFAFRVQYGVMAVIAISLVSATAGLWTHPSDHAIDWWLTPDDGASGQAAFWVVFAVFFPATTGILAGANMSGELKNPRRSIPLGTLSAVAVGTAIYLLLAVWFSRMATSAELRTNYVVIIERAGYGPLVVAGLLGATFSSALTSLVGAPRILSALASSQVVPRAGWLVGRPGREPRRAMLVTAALSLTALLLRDLNVIAPLITMFFLITYGMINVVVLLEQRLAVVSFRPRLRVPAIVPLVGAVGCLFAMFVVNAAFSLVAVAVVVMVYGLLMRRKLKAPHEDVRSGLFLMVAEWAARKATTLSRGQSKAWKANLLVPVVDRQEVVGNFSLIVDLTKPYGSVTLLGIADAEHRSALDLHIEELANDFTEAGVHTTATTLESRRPGRAMVHAMQTLRSSFLRPNLLFLTPLTSAMSPEALEEPLRRAKRNRMGVVLAALHPKTALGRRHVIHVWIRAQAPDWDLEVATQRSNLNLQMLIPYLLVRRWNAKLTLCCVVAEPEQRAAAEDYLRRMIELTRMPIDAGAQVVVGEIDGAFELVPSADLNVFGLPHDHELELVRSTVERTSSACLFVRDSGEEDALS